MFSFHFRHRQLGSRRIGTSASLVPHLLFLKHARAMPASMYVLRGVYRNADVMSGRETFNFCILLRRRRNGEVRRAVSFRSVDDSWQGSWALRIAHQQVWFYMWFNYQGPSHTPHGVVLTHVGRRWLGVDYLFRCVCVEFTDAFRFDFSVQMYIEVGSDEIEDPDLLALGWSIVPEELIVEDAFALIPPRI